MTSSSLSAPSGATSSVAFTRAPALYFVGALPSDGGTDPFAFRLPCPPVWDDRHPGAWAAERRARRAYFAALDALRRGAVDAEEEAKARRLLADLRSPGARGAVTHFLRIFEMVRTKADGPVIPTPPVPLRELLVTAPPVGLSDSASLSARYRWALEWLDARRYVVGKGLELEWRVRRVTLAGMVVVPADVGLPGALQGRAARELAAR